MDSEEKKRLFEQYMKKRESEGEKAEDPDEGLDDLILEALRDDVVQRREEALAEIIEQGMRIQKRRRFPRTIFSGKRRAVLGWAALLAIVASIIYLLRRDPDPPALMWPASGLAAVDPTGDWRRAGISRIDPDLVFGAGTLGASEGKRRAQLSTVVVETSGKYGAGAIVSPDGLIVTNYTLLEENCRDLLLGIESNAIQIKALDQGGETDPGLKSYKATVVAMSSRFDLALLVPKSEESTDDAVSFFQLQFEVGEDTKCTGVGRVKDGYAWFPFEGEVEDFFRLPGSLVDIAGEAFCQESGLDLRSETRDPSGVGVIDTSINTLAASWIGPLADDEGRLLGFALSPSRIFRDPPEGSRFGDYFVAATEVERLLVSYRKARDQNPGAFLIEPWPLVDAGVEKREYRVLDLDDDNLVEAVILYQYADPNDASPMSVAALVDFSTSSARDGIEEGTSVFRWQFLFLVTAPGSSLGFRGACAYRTEGKTDEIRVDRNGDQVAEIVWKRGGGGIDERIPVSPREPLLSPSRLGRGEVRTVERVYAAVVRPES